MDVVVRVVVSVISALTETKGFCNSMLECGFSGILGLLYFIAHSLPTSPMAGCFLDYCSSRILSGRPPLHKFGGLFVGFGIIAEWRSGVIDRQLVTPAARTSIIAGRTLRDVVVITVQGIVLVGCSWLLGLRVGP